MDYRTEAALIVDALINDKETELIPFSRVTFKPTAKPEPKTKPVGRNPYTRPDDLPHCKICGSRHHTTPDCPHHHQGSPIV